MTSTSQNNLRENYDEEGDLNYDFGTNRHLVQGSSVARYMDGDKIEAMIAHYTSSDKSSDKTFTRQFVEEYLQKRRWYFPGHNNPKGPSLSKAYAYYEHFTLARHIHQTNAEHKLERAEPGTQEETSLYSPLWTPESQLMEFGIGVASYFSTLRVLGVILIIAGLIHMPNILFYSGNSYSKGQSNPRSATLKGTALCNEGEWVVCTTCKWTDYDNLEERDRFANSTDPISGVTTTLVLRNACERPGIREGMINFSGFIFLLVSFFLFSVYQRKREQLFDESKQTATDYSVVVNNPPPDAYDCDEWRDFFSQFADKQVIAVTVALDNYELLDRMMHRRVLRSRLKEILPKHFDLDDEDQVRVEVARILKEQEMERKGPLDLIFGCMVLPILRLMDISLSPDVLVDKIFQLTDEIKELMKKKYNVTKVFVTFETEVGQRNCLEALSTSKMAVRMNDVDKVLPNIVFRGRILHVTEPVEPNTVRWMDLHVKTGRKYIQRVITFLLTSCMVGLAGWLVYQCRLTLGAEYAGPLTIVFNSLIPLVVKLLLLFESHSNEGSRQESLFLKITLFRWVNTVVLAKAITPFTSTISGGPRDVLTTVNSILWAELILSPLLKLLDIFGNINKHIIAPRMRTQESMNRYFQGTPYNLGERYTDLTKVLFLCFFYSALFPAAFFFGGVILFFQYYSDKYCLMRIWQSAPFLGSKLAVFSRRFFFSGALLTYIVVAGYDWAQFPYDNLCDPVEAASGYNKTYSYVAYLDKQKNPDGFSTLTVVQPTNVIECKQDWLSTDAFPFPSTASRLQSISRQWMTNEQESVSNIFGWSSLVLVILFFVTFLARPIFLFFAGFVTKTYTSNGVDAKIDFKNVVEISVYVPQFKVDAFNFPILACDIDGINTNWIGWSDPTDPSYDKHNLIFDVPHENMKRQSVHHDTVNMESTRGEVKIVNKSEPLIFSLVKTW